MVGQGVPFMIDFNKLCKAVRANPNTTDKAKERTTSYIRDVESKGYITSEQFDTLKQIDYEASNELPGKYRHVKKKGYFRKGIRY